MDTSKLDSMSQSAIFQEEFVMKDSEVVPSKGLVGETLNLHDFESIAAESVSALDNILKKDD